MVAAKANTWRKRSRRGRLGARAPAAGTRASAGAPAAQTGRNTPRCHRERRARPRRPRVSERKIMIESSDRAAALAAPPSGRRSVRGAHPRRRLLRCWAVRRRCGPQHAAAPPDGRRSRRQSVSSRSAAARARESASRRAGRASGTWRRRWSSARRGGVAACSTARTVSSSSTHARQDRRAGEVSRERGMPGVDLERSTPGRPRPGIRLLLRRSPATAAPPAAASRWRCAAGSQPGAAGAAGTPGRCAGAAPRDRRGVEPRGHDTGADAGSPRHRGPASHRGRTLRRRTPGMELSWWLR